jgi:IS30 family transposase
VQQKLELDWSHARPPVVELRSRVGDWEGDLIVGRMSKSAIGTLVDRTRPCFVGS